MNPKTKKILIISGIAIDLIATILLFVFSIVLLANMPAHKALIDPNTFLGWFEIEPIRILLIDVLPLAALLITNISLTVWYIKKTGKKEQERKKKYDKNNRYTESKSLLMTSQTRKKQLLSKRFCKR